MSSGEDPEVPVDIVVITKRAASEEDYLCCFTSAPSLETTENQSPLEEFNVNVEDLSHTLEINDDMGILIVQNQLFMTEVNQFMLLNSSSPNSAAKIPFVNVSKGLKTTTKFTHASAIGRLVGLTAPDGYHLFITESQFHKYLRNDNEKLKQFTTLLAMDAMLVKIDHHKFFNGEQIRKIHKVTKGIIFQTIANSFYLMVGMDLFKNWYMEANSETTVSSPFHKLKIPKNAQTVCTRKNILAYILEGIPYLRNQVEEAVQLDVKGKCKYLTIIHEVLICLTSNGCCHCFDVESRKQLLMVDAQEFGDEFTEVHYAYEPYGDNEFQADKLLFFSEGTQQLYTIENSEIPKLKQVQLRQLVREKKYFIRENQEADSDDETESEHAAEEQLKNKPILDYYDRRLREGWRIKTIKSCLSGLVFVFHKYKGTGHFIKRPLSSYQMNLTDLTITTRL